MVYELDSVESLSVFATIWEGQLFQHLYLVCNQSKLLWMICIQLVLL